MRSWLLGLYPTEGKLLAMARIFYAEEARQLDTIVALVDEKSGKEVLRRHQTFLCPGPCWGAESSAAPELPFLARAVTYGDFEGNGKPVYAFSDGTRLHLYRNEPSGWHEVWTETTGMHDAIKLEWFGLSSQADPASTMQHINIDSADINGNGRPEIFVTAMFERQGLLLCHRVPGGRLSPHRRCFRVSPRDPVSREGRHADRPGL